jgi:hypothetical protein
VSSRVTVDGRGLDNVAQPRYGVFAPQRTLLLPPDNIYDLPPQRITMSAHGWMVFVLDLPLGVHAIRSYNTFKDGSVYDFTKYVTVIRR